MFQLSVTYEFDLESDDRPALARIHAVRAYLESREGFLEAEVHQLDRNRFTLVSRWESDAAADAALHGERASEQVARRAGILHDRPDAIGVSFA